MRLILTTKHWNLDDLNILTTKNSGSETPVFFFWFCHILSNYQRFFHWLVMVVGLIFGRQVVAVTDSETSFPQRHRWSFAAGWLFSILVYMSRFPCHLGEGFPTIWHTYLHITYYMHKMHSSLGLHNFMFGSLRAALFKLFQSLIIQGPKRCKKSCLSFWMGLLIIGRSGTVPLK